MNEQTVIELAHRENLDRRQRLTVGRSQRALRNRAGRALVRWGTRIGRLNTSVGSLPQRRLAAAAR